MIQISNFKDADVNRYDYCINIMLSKNFTKPGMLHFQQLAPRPELFKLYQKLKAAGEWSTTTFNDLYVPIFLERLCSEESRERLNWLYWMSTRNGASIQLCCSCYDEDICHRSIVGGVLEGVGATVLYQTPTSYIDYYLMYKEKRGG